MELVYQSPLQGADAYDYRFTTQMRVLPQMLPFEADYNRDRATSTLDLAIFSDVWLTDNTYRDIAPRWVGDAIINFYDFGIFASHWLQDYSQ